MHMFEYRDGQLFCEEVPAEQIVQAYGTPLYCYSLGTVMDHFEKIRDAFSKVSPLICYAVKANSNRDILSGLAREGAGADVVSAGEIYLAMDAGVPADRIVYAGVGKTEEEMAFALRRGIYMFNLESLEEAKTLSKVAEQLGTAARVAVRINPDVDAHTHEKITTGKKENKFGVSSEKLKENASLLASLPGLEWVGLHVHIGSQIVEVAPFHAALDSLLELAEDLEKKGIQMTHLNLGGGCAIEYGNNKAFTAEELADKLLPRLEGRGVRLLLEPGRFIVGNGGILVTKVLYRKRADTKQFLVVDASMTDLVRPSMYDAYHSILPLREPNRKETETVDVVGPVCESGDFLAKERQMPRVDRGERLAVFSAGAYGYAMASNYNGRPRPAEVVVRGDRFHLSRRRETRSDLVVLNRGRIPFVKMVASGNDFVVLDATVLEEIVDLGGLARSLCSRQFGVGADGVLLLCPGEEVDLSMRILNADGTEAEMCGNGARCACMYAYERGWCREELSFEALDGLHRARIEGGKVAITLNLVGDQRWHEELALRHGKLAVHFFNSGVPHAVTIWDDVNAVDVESLGGEIRWHGAFQPQGTNADFVQIKTENDILVRTFERGVESETLACGTGVVASALVCAHLDEVKSPVRATTTGGGVLTVSFQRENDSFGNIWLEGDADAVFRGTVKGEIC